MLFPAPQQARQIPRVVITGAGIITALGQGWKENAEGFRVGRTAFRPVKLFDVSRQRVKMAAEVDIGELPRTSLRRSELRRMDRAGKLLLIAAEEAIRQAGWAEGAGVPMTLGTTSGGMSLGEAFYRQSLRAPPSDVGQRTRVVAYQAQRQVLNLAEAFALNGQITIIANACASGANAIGQAWHQIRQGRAERVLTGGYEALSQLVFSGFDSLQALSPTQCRPFDAYRDGLALGEGAGVIALESYEYARARGASILGELKGYGVATDVHHLTQPHPAGDAAYASMVRACETAGLNPGQIQYINAHGTGTPLNDSAEAAAINRWAGTDVGRVAVSSTKASIGHLLGAAGAVETIVCLMALREQWLPPTRTLQTPDPGCAFPIVREPTARTFEYALTNSFGFGGANASLILRRWP